MVNILYALLAQFVAFDCLLTFLAPFYVRSFGLAAPAELERLAAPCFFFGLLLCAAWFALGECHRLMLAAWPVLQMLWSHAVRPGLPCPNWNCPRCWETRGVVLGPSRLFGEEGK